MLHGAMMQYDQSDFLEKVTDFLDETSRNIASSKFSVIKDATRRKEIKNELAATEDRLKERQVSDPLVRCYIIYPYITLLDTLTLGTKHYITYRLYSYITYP